MSCVTNRFRLRQLGRQGTTSLEFALVAIPFLFILIAGMDLGRYFITQHSLRTLTAEAARSAMVNCFGSTGACNLTPVQKTAVETASPFLVPGNFLTFTVSQSAPSGDGVRTITVTAIYPFSFILPVWAGLNGPITVTASVLY
jgi:TadE-like protein